MVAGTFWVESEFLSLVGGACGPNAAAMAESWADQQYRSTRATFLRFAHVGACNGSGVSTGGGLVKGLGADGFRTRRQYPAGNWLAFLKARMAEPAVVIVELAAAHNLRDAITGAGMDAGSGLAYHYICACDYHAGGYSARAGRTLPEGFFCADGDSNATNPVVNGKRTRVSAGHTLQFYPVSTLAAARPCDLIAVYPRVKLGSGIPGGGGGSGGSGGGGSMQVPAGWHDDGATLTASNGVVVVKGFRELVLGSSWDAANVPHAPEVGDASSSYQAFAQGVATWHTGAQPVYAPCAALVAALTAPQVIPDRYSKALAAIESLATAVAADKAA